MPAIVRLYLKTALVYLVLAVALAVVLSISPPPTATALWAGLRPVQLHLLVLGWLTQLIFGVALWMFPRYTKEQPRGPEWLGYSVWGLLNVGLVLRSVSEPLRMVTTPATPIYQTAGVGLAASAVLLLLAGWGFVWLVWPRVRER